MASPLLTSHEEKKNNAALILQQQLTACLSFVTPPLDATEHMLNMSVHIYKTFASVVYNIN